jgi:membrane-bound serine protease (ClpP class)
VSAVGEAREDLSPEGLVFVRGALWKAKAERGPIPAGTPVQVVGRNGLRLDVVAAVAEVTKER